MLILSCCFVKKETPNWSLEFSDIFKGKAEAVIVSAYP